jgi:hypothetical protein
MSHDDIQSLWQNQPVPELHWTVDDLRKKRADWNAVCCSGTCSNMLPVCW